MINKEREKKIFIYFFSKNKKLEFVNEFGFFDMNKIRVFFLQYYIFFLKLGLMIKCYYNFNVIMIVIYEKMIKMKYIFILYWVIYGNKLNLKESVLKDFIN